MENTGLAAIVLKARFETELDKKLGDVKLQSALRPVTLPDSHLVRQRHVISVFTFSLELWFKTLL